MDTTSSQPEQATVTELRAQIQRLEAELARVRGKLQTVTQQEKYQADSDDPRQARPL